MERTFISDLPFDRSATAISRWPLRWVANVLAWQSRLASRQQLARLDSRLLADAGISEAQRQAELGKPFWR